MKKIKVSVIGTGHLGKIHTKLWNELDSIEFAGIYDINDNNANLIAKEYNCRKFNSIDEAISNSDALTISAPTTDHFNIAKTCIENGIHCLIEKPITSSYAEAKELINLAKNKNITIQVGHVERFNPALTSLKGYDLKPVFIEAHRLSQFKPRAIDVSVVHDLMIHDIDIVLWLVKSEVDKIEANGVAVLTDTIDIANARITFKNKTVVNLTASRISAHPQRKMRLFQQNAYISIDFGNQELEVFRLLNSSECAGKNIIPTDMLGSLEAGLKNQNIVFEKPKVPEINAIAEEQKAFINAISMNKPSPVGADEAAEALRIAEEINNIIENNL